MAFFVTGEGGESAQKAASDRLRGLIGRSFTAKTAQEAVTAEVKAHVAAKYPGSRHWSPDKVTPGSLREGTSAEAETVVDIAGASRAYSDLTIRPKFRQYLAIPIRQEAFGRAPSEFDGLFFVRNRNGNAFLAMNAPGGQLAFMYSLSKSAFQGRDPSLMPSDERLADAVFALAGRKMDEAK